ncbi:MAG: DUF6600 domain-containing protein [Bacteroidales bacterium]
MKTKILISLLMIFLAGSALTPQRIPAQGVSVGFEVFYNELSPYGTWIDNPDYGYVWLPDVGPGFTPYSTNGYWIFTDQGWTWVSNYSWGWAPFHYGRWFMDDRYGAMWVPDYEWGPGWVTWRMSAGYYGWAPIGPGISINIAYGNSYNIPDNRWTFVRDRDFGRRDINNYYVNQTQNVTIINNSTVIVNNRVDRSRNVTYNAGPERGQAEQRSGRKFTPVAVTERAKPGQRVNSNQLQIYKPEVRRSAPSGPKPAPSKVGRIENIKTIDQRRAMPPAQRSQPAKQQPPQQQRPAQPAKQQPAQQQRPAQPARQQPSSQQPQQPQQRQTQPAKQQPAQQQPQQRQAQPVKQQPAQQQPQQRQAQPAKQQPAQQQPQHRPAQPPRQQPAQPQQVSPSKGGGNDKEKDSPKPPRNM